MAISGGSINSAGTRSGWWALGVCAAIFQLLLVVAGATHFGVPGSGRLARGLRYYGKLSGAANNYSFFSPGIDGDLRVLFDVTGPDGQVRTVPFEATESREAQLRVADIVGQFDVDGDDEETVEREGRQLGRELSASLAGTAFGRYPGSRKVQVRLEQLTPVSMSQFRSGERAR